MYLCTSYTYIIMIVQCTFFIYECGSVAKIVKILYYVFACQPIRMRSSNSSIFVFMLRWPSFLMASIYAPAVQIDNIFNKEIFFYEFL